MLIARAALRAARAHAAGTPAVEVCGLLLGPASDRIAAAVPARNVADDPARWFEVDPGALFAALRAERAGGARLLGHYHSHPNGSPEPSPRDAAAAVPGRLWLILGGPRARLWRAGVLGFQPLRMRYMDDPASRRREFP